jgi:hypothetical protein
LYFYGELPSEEEDHLEQHLDACAACSRQAEQYRALAVALDRRAVEPPPMLLAECRHGLMQAVERVQVPAPRASSRSTAWPHFREGFAALLAPFSRWRTPFGAVALVALGFFAARFSLPAGGGLSKADLPGSDNVISSVRSIQPNASGQVQIVLDETRRRTVSGELHDKNIEQLMLAAAHDETNPALRVESVDILKSHSDSSEIRGLLLNRVLQDPNPYVRLRALDGLKPFTSEPDVRKAMAQVLERDDNPGVRIQVVDLLTAHADDQIVGVLQNVVQKDDNTYIRRRCAETLKDMNASVGTF